MALRLDSRIEVFEDRKSKGDWRVEYFDDDGGCYVVIFVGPFAEKRARDYASTLKARKLAPIPNSHPRPGVLGTARRAGRRKAAEMAGRQIDRMDDQTASGKERARRKRRLIKGPQELRGIRGDRPKGKSDK